MEPPKIQLIKQRLEALLCYLQPHWDFVNCHMVNFLTDGHWQRFVPPPLRAEVSDAQSVQRCIASVFWRQQDQQQDLQNFKAFRDFLLESEQHRLQHFSDVLTTPQQLREILGLSQRAEQLHIKEFMSEKKQHEVEITAALVDDLLEQQEHKNPQAALYVIDAGDGKGYLSSRLALQYKRHVLGIDYNAANTENALERGRKLQRAWQALSKRAELESQGVTPPRRGKAQRQYEESAALKKALENYKTTAKFITSELNFEQLLREHFPAASTQHPLQLCLTGLHTCGNLAPACLKVFHAQPQFKLLCNIGCCYHLLQEEFSVDEFYGSKAVKELQTEPGFPLSAFLRERQVRLGRNARMLAAQSIERTLAAQELPNISLYYRAMLEVLICEQDAQLKDTVQVGKVRKFSNFAEYYELCARKANLQFDALNATKRIDDLEKLYAPDRHYLDLFYLLRMSFAPVLESLILLDRLLYLQELEHEQSYLVPLFDAVISPRHFGIVALKS